MLTLKVLWYKDTSRVDKLPTACAGVEQIKFQKQNDFEESTYEVEDDVLDTVKTLLDTDQHCVRYRFE